MAKVRPSRACVFIVYCAKSFIVRNRLLCENEAVREIKPHTHMASSNESEILQLSFHGQMNIIDGITREDIMGSGHLGPSYVGVASIREGRGQMVRGPPKPVHIM